MLSNHNGIKFEISRRTLSIKSQIFENLVTHFKISHESKKEIIREI